MKRDSEKSYLNDQVWKDQAAQDTWAAMWRYTAELRFRRAFQAVMDARGWDTPVDVQCQWIYWTYVKHALDRLGRLC